MPLTATTLNSWLRSLHAVREPSVDRIIVGKPDTEVRGIGVCWMPTWATLREAAAKGCNVVVTHEPTFYTHLDSDEAPDLAKIPAKAKAAVHETQAAKRRWIEENGMVVIRCHDVLDGMPGGIVDSFVHALGFPNTPSRASDYFRVVNVGEEVEAAVLARRLARVFKQVNHPAIAFYGDPKRRVRLLGVGTGYSSSPWDFVERGAQMGITIDDRIKTWTETVWAADSGFPLVVVHHGATEEWGTRTLAQLLAKEYASVKVQHFPQGCTATWISDSI